MSKQDDGKAPRTVPTEPAARDKTDTSTDWDEWMRRHGGKIPPRPDVADERGRFPDERESPPQPVPPDKGQQPPVKEPPDSPGQPPPGPDRQPEGDPIPKEPPRLVRRRT